jgi:hypothetical protein
VLPCPLVEGRPQGWLSRLLFGVQRVHDVLVGKFRVTDLLAMHRIIAPVRRWKSLRIKVHRLAYRFSVDF